jgi:uncharacterized membrane protein YfcA
MGGWLTTDFFSIIAAGFVVGIVVGLTGMGGGALMTPALIFLGVGNASAVVTADLTAAAISRSAGAATHARQGSPNMTLAKWLIIGSVPAALVGPWIIHRVAGGSHDSLDRLLMECIGFALLFAAATYAVRLYVNLRRTHRHDHERADPDPPIRPLVTLGVGAFGGLLVGITSVGAGSVIMIALLMLYPGLSPVRLVGTDLVQAVPLVLAAAASNIAINGLDWHILVPLVIGSTPGTVLGARVAPKVPQSYIRRAIVVVLTMSSVALLDKSGWAPLGAGKSQTHPVLVGGVGVALIVLVPLVWGLIRRTEGLPMFGSPTVAELEGEEPRARRTATSDITEDQSQLP